LFWFILFFILWVNWFFAPKSASKKVHPLFSTRIVPFSIWKILKTKIRKWEFEIKIKMKEDNVGGSEVIVEPHRLTTSDEMNNGSAGGSSSASARAVVVRNATKVYGSGKNRCAVLEGLNMTIKKGDM
jgi:hypothetical protein